MKNTFRTSNTLFKAQVQVYIIQSLSTDETTDLQEQLFHTVQAFNNDYDSSYNQKKIPNKQDRFIDFLKCLPSEIYITPYYHEISKLMESWFTNCNQPYTPKTNESDTFYSIIYMNFQRLCKQNDINF